MNESRVETGKLNQVSYLLRAKDEDIFYHSQSGGAFVLFSDFVLNQKGIVFAACLDEHNELRHIRINSRALRNRARGSVYVQSGLSDTFKEVEKCLEDDILVLFTGTPCQCAGLRSYISLKKINSDHLIVVDLLCHGVASVDLWKSYIAYYKSRHGRLMDIRLNSSNRRVRPYFEFIFENGIETDALYKKLYYSNLALRPSCYKCRFTNLDRQGDISIGDAQGVQEKDPDFYNSKGTAFVLINTEKGRALFDRIEQSVDYKKVVLQSYLQEALMSQVKTKRDRSVFWHDYRSKDFKYVLDKYAYHKVWLNIGYIIKRITGGIAGYENRHFHIS